MKTKEVIINGCYGGFGISNEALLELIKMKSKIVNKISIKEYYGGENPNFKDSWSKRWKEDKVKLKSFKLGFFSHPYLCGLLYDNEFVYSIERDKELRSNPDLIKIVKKLKGKANGDFSSLKIVEIPENISYEIDEYDGMESIEESHRSWI